jgi:predicted MPP superfamily phosphohydrolase
VDHRIALAVIFFLMPLSFVGSMFLAHAVDNILTRVFYFCASLWLGVGLTLLAALGCAWVALGVAGVAGLKPRPLWFGIAALTLTVLYSAYGIVNAYHPRPVECTVRIKNLPSGWQGKTIVQLSDVHLGRIFRAKFLSRVVEKVNAQNPEMVLITGDLFDGARGNLEALVAPLNRMNAPQGTYFVTGNHEAYLGVSHAVAALRTTPVTVLSDECVMVDGLQVVGIAYPDGRDARGFSQRLAAVTEFNPHLPSILLYHTPSQIPAAKAAGISLQLSGHVHQGQIFPLQFVTRLIYGKYYHGLTSEGDFTIYTSSGTGAWGPTMRTGNHPEIVVIRLETA